MIDPRDLVHPIDISYEFKEELKRQVELGASVSSYPSFSLISGMSFSHSMNICLRLKGTMETICEQHIPFSKNLIEEKLPYEY